MNKSLLFILAGVAFVVFLVLGKKKEEAPLDGTAPGPGYAPDSLAEQYIARMRAATTNVGLTEVYEEAGEHYGGYLAPYFTEAQYARITAVYRALPWPEESTPSPSSYTGYMRSPSGVVYEIPFLVRSQYLAMGWEDCGSGTW
jgi:hypothetical protein